MRRRILASATAATARVAVAVPAAGAFGSSAQGVAKPLPKPKVVTVGDDYFAPVSVSVKTGSRVQWKWAPMNFDTHNVVLSKGPKSVKRGQFKSSSGAIGIKFIRKFTVPGSYRFVCTFHRALMQMTLTVKKR